METKDHYEYWSRIRKTDEKIYDREKKSLDFISEVVEGNSNFLDLGCGYGKFLAFIKKRFPNLKVKGIDYSKKEISIAKKSGLDVKWCNFETGINENDNSFDIVYSGEVIEHLYNPDIFLSEVSRILKKNGYLILSTPNLCAWFNRILMLFGIQPLFVEPSTKSKLVGAGILKRFKKDAHPVGHVRIFTIEALKDMLKMNNLRLI